VHSKNRRVARRRAKVAGMATFSRWPF